jgi:hypothetical protein
LPHTETDKEDTMPAIERSVEVDASAETADHKLREFGLRAAIGGDERDEAGVGFDPADSCEVAETTRFEQMEPDRTRVTRSVDYDESDPACAAAVARQVDRQMQRFRQFAQGRAT